MFHHTNTHVHLQITRSSKQMAQEAISRWRAAAAETRFLGKNQSWPVNCCKLQITPSPSPSPTCVRAYVNTTTNHLLDRSSLKARASLLPLRANSGGPLLVVSSAPHKIRRVARARTSPSSGTSPRRRVTVTAGRGWGWEWISLKVHAPMEEERTTTHRSSWL